jgi:hydroxymethylpyrimidine/phosphomethylpyrimidine kinase
MDRGDARVIPVALTIAGSDSGGGAGIQADLKTFTALGVFGTSAITAITAQNTLGVRLVHTLAPDVVVAQIAAVCEDFDVAAIKIGMLASVEIVEAVASALEPAPCFVVLDPVMAASSGDALSGVGFIHALAGLIPKLDLLTPNLAEAAALTGTPQARSETEMAVQARALVDKGARAVLMKGGHLDGDAVELLVTARGQHRFAAPRINSHNLHGTGCVLSSAIAANIALGHDLVTTVAEAKAFTRRAIENGRLIRLGGGPGPLVPAP